MSGTVATVTVSESDIPQITSATLVFWDGYSLILSWLVLETWLVTSSTACANGDASLQAALDILDHPEQQ